MNSEPHFVNCRNCGEQNFREDRYCWICHSPLEDEDSLRARTSSRSVSTKPRPKSTFVTTEFLVITCVILLTVGMVTNRMWGLAIMMWIVLLPVGLSIRIRSGKKIDRSERETGVEKMRRFSSSLFVTIGFVIVVILAAGIGFFVTCTLSFALNLTPQKTIGLGIMLGSVVGILIVYMLIRLFRRRKK